MGTNYYLWGRESAKHTALLDPSDGLHICKSLTNFQGHKTSPFGTISSWQDWKHVFAQGDFIVLSEYADPIEIEKFIEWVEAEPVSARRRQYDWMHEKWPKTETGQIFPEWVNEYWLDDDQFTFSFRAFS